ncbi:zinc-finger-containing protein [Variovorax paradoxus]|uniref:zinc-finger-containing protein n=1 Tax=Variovorax paradoxus TaxID=34073 RepID=UPI0030D29490
MSPWVPSRRAVARVRNPLPVPEKCPHCSSPVFIDSNACIYGREYGEWPWALMCTGCDSYVGLHLFTGIPLGTLATPPMRRARGAAKDAFNPLWQGGGMTRTEAYAWLAGALGIADVEQCHIGWFDVAQCAAVVAAVKARTA